MKTKLILTFILFLGLSVLGQTYTNNTPLIRLKISDQQLEMIRSAWKITGSTNMTLVEFATNNIHLELSQEIMQALLKYRQRLVRELTDSTDIDADTLQSVDAILAPKRRTEQTVAKTVPPPPTPQQP